MLRVTLWKVSLGPMIAQPMYNETNLFLTTIECFFGLMHGWLAGNAKTHSKIVSWKVLSGLKRKTFLSKDFSKRRATKIFLSCCLNFRLENPGVNICIFNCESAVYLQVQGEKKVLLRDYTLLHILRIHGRQRFHGELKERLCIHSRLKLSELPASPFGSLESSFKALERKNYLLCAFPEFTSKISLVIFLHNWFTWGAMAQADNSELHSNVRVLLGYSPDVWLAVKK